MWDGRGGGREGWKEERVACGDLVTAHEVDAAKRHQRPAPVNDLIRVLRDHTTPINAPSLGHRLAGLLVSAKHRKRETQIEHVNGASKANNSRSKKEVGATLRYTFTRPIGTIDVAMSRTKGRFVEHGTCRGRAWYLPAMKQDNGRQPLQSGLYQALTCAHMSAQQEAG